MLRACKPSPIQQHPTWLILHNRPTPFSLSLRILINGLILHVFEYERAAGRETESDSQCRVLFVACPVLSV